MGFVDLFLLISLFEIRINLHFLICKDLYLKSLNITFVYRLSLLLLDLKKNYLNLFINLFETQ